MKFIGMDAHSRTSTFVVLGKRGRVLHRARIDTTEERLLDFVRSVKGKKELAFEEGVMSQWLYLLFKDEVDDLTVCQPREKGGAKTDEIDAGEIADLLRVGRLKPVFHEDSELMYLRTLISGYGDAVEEIVRTKNRYKALYRQVAIPTNVPRFYESKDMLDLLDTDVRRYVACGLFEQLGLLENQRRGYLERFEENARTYKPIELLMSIPGIGKVRANQIVAVMVTPYRFPSKYHLFAYAGLTMHTRTSDGKQYGKKRARGPSLLKDVFKSAVLSSIRSNTAFRRKYDAMRSAGKSDRVARGAIARKIAATTLGVWKSGKKYDDKHWEVTQQQSRSCHSGV